MGAAEGAYIQRLRTHHGLSRACLALRVETSYTQIMRIEEGTQETKASLLIHLISEVKGDFSDVCQLVLTPHATAAAGIELAEQRIMGLERGAGRMEPPITALGAYLRGLRERARRQLYEQHRLLKQTGWGALSPAERRAHMRAHTAQRELVDYEVDDAYIDSVNEGTVSLVDITLKLLALQATPKEIEFLLDNPDLSPEIGERLARTRIGIGNVDVMIRHAKEGSG